MPNPLKTKLRDTLLQSERVYRLYLKYKWGAARPRGYPQAHWKNAVLKTHEEWKGALEQVKSLGLPPHIVPSKNWDSLAALDSILNHTHPAAHILDAGAELYSTILPWLFLYGYRHLTGINLTFDRPLHRGPLSYEYGDITQTRFKENTFDAITCLSVVEHGVDLKAYFKEMSRILKPNGLLITSTDYYESPTKIHGKMAFGVPIHIFSKDEILAAFNSVREFGLEFTEAIDLGCQERVVSWEGFTYTYLIFTLQKKINVKS